MSGIQEQLTPLKDYILNPFCFLELLGSALPEVNL